MVKVQLLLQVGAEGELLVRMLTLLPVLPAFVLSAEGFIGFEPFARMSRSAFTFNPRASCLKVLWGRPSKWARGPILKQP